MQTKISSKGQFVVPRAIRHKLGLRPGDTFEATLEGERTVLSKVAKSPIKVRIVTDPVTGLPVLAPKVKGPGITSELVKKLLADFP